MHDHPSCESNDLMGAAPEFPAGFWGLCMVVVLRALQDPVRLIQHDDIHREVVRAELAGELSEFCALNVQALLAISERSEYAADYLDMAEAVASSPGEHAIVVEARQAHAWIQSDPVAATIHLQVALSDDDRAMDLCNRLMIELCHLGHAQTGSWDTFVSLMFPCTTVETTPLKC